MYCGDSDSNLMLTTTYVVGQFGKLCQKSPLVKMKSTTVSQKAYIVETNT